MSNYIEDIIEAKLLNLHTTYLAKVVSVSGGKATVQPLSMIKQFGRAAQKLAPIPDVPIAGHCKGRVVEKDLRYVSGVSGGSTSFSNAKILTFEPLRAGDVVVCCCGERDISEAKAGKISTPVSGRHHDLSDSIILGVL